MYRLDPILKKILKISLIIFGMLEIIFLIIKWQLGLTFAIGYVASVIVLLKSNYFITNALYNISNPKNTLKMNYLFSVIIYFFALLVSFFIGIVPGLFCGLGTIIIKVIIVVSGFLKKAGD